MVIGRIVYKEKKYIFWRSHKNWDNLENAISTLKPNLIRKKEFLIILDESSSLIDWHI